MKRTWSVWLIALAVLFVFGLGVATHGREAQGVDQQAIFRAVEAWLSAAHVAKQDMPKAVKSIQTLPNGHYLVHMQMYVGEAWFEVWQEGGAWKVRGASPPGR